MPQKVEQVHGTIGHLPGALQAVERRVADGAAGAVLEEQHGPVGGCGIDGVQLVEGGEGVGGVAGRAKIGAKVGEPM